MFFVPLQASDGEIISNILRILRICMQSWHAPTGTIYAGMLRAHMHACVYIYIISDVWLGNLALVLVSTNKISRVGFYLSKCFLF